MTNYNTLTTVDKARVDAQVLNEIKPGTFTTKYTDEKITYTEPDYTLRQIHNGNYCAKCWNSYYTCVCSHED